MLSIPQYEDARFAKQLSQLDHFNRFISAVATAIVSGNDQFESVFSVANRVCDRYCSPKVRFMSRRDLDESGRTALSA
jgi:hypothetical protein